MGRQSIKENKNIYFTSREAAGLTREAAADRMPGMGPDRIERIESEKVYPRPEDVTAMADAYKAPELLNYYCTAECPIGKRTVIPVDAKELSQIALSMLKSLGELDARKDKLIDIAIDNKIDSSELPEFVAIKDALAESRKRYAEEHGVGLDERAQHAREASESIEREGASARPLSLEAR